MTATETSVTAKCFPFTSSSSSEMTLLVWVCMISLNPRWCFIRIWKMFRGFQFPIFLRLSIFVGTALITLPKVFWPSKEAVGKAWNEISKEWRITISCLCLNWRSFEMSSQQMEKIQKHTYPTLQLLGKKSFTLCLQVCTRLRWCHCVYASDLLPWSFCSRV